MCIPDTVLTHPTIGAVTSDGLTPLGVAVREERLGTIKYLITECNVDINSKLVYLFACIHSNDIIT